MSLSRSDFQVISDWISPNARVLDLGCGNGELLSALSKNQGVSGYGIEIDDKNISQCINAGVNVIQRDLDLGLSDFDEDSFDYVILSMTLQASNYPHRLLGEMLRVSAEGIVTFPNFGNIKSRIQLGLGGRMPVNRTLPLEWYNTPNVHLCTLKDFEELCEKLDIEILERRAVSHNNKSGPGLKLFPNLFGEIALYRFRKKV
ncbi:MAG: methionine biosynthesis protein MetW [Gammaproteobacteria bacterium]|nr:methionine biosynthesis protein MetW [Gammaproteobacteria bacterium]